MKQILVAVALVMVGLVPGVSQAATIFSDDFNTENLGVTALNYTGFTNWAVSAGTVDLIGVGGSFDLIPGNGLYVDMDGTTNDAGIMTSTALSVSLGQAYELTFDLAGSQRTGGDIGVNTLTFGIDIDNNGTIDIPGPLATLGTFVGFTPFSLPFTATIAFTDPRIIFGQNGGDNRGLLLDNVQVQTVPEPTSLMLLGAGLAALGIWRRKAAKV